MENLETKREVDFDLVEILNVLKSKIVLIVLSCVICAVVAAIGLKVTEKPAYQSETSLYVLSDIERKNLTNSDLAKNTMLTNDYAELIKSRTVMSDVIKHNHLEMPIEKLIDATKVDVKNGTRVIKISVVNGNPEMAKQLADSVREEGSKQIQNVMNAETVKVVDKAYLPTKPISTNFKIKVLLAGLLGLFAAISFVIVKYVLDDTIKTVDDVEKILGLSVLGTIPYDSSLNKNKKPLEHRVSRNTTSKRKKRGNN